MREDLKILEKIDQYIDGHMSAAELSAFQNEINNNPTLKSQVDNQQLIVQATKRQVLSNQINAASSGGGFFKFNWTLGIGLIFLLITIVTYTQLDLEQANNDEDIELGVSTDPSINEINDSSTYKIEETVLVDTSSTILAESSMNKERVIQTPFKEPETDTTSQSNFDYYDFNGLKCWVEPKVQTFEIDANATETIEGENGTLIIIPENSFLDENGNQVNGKVSFELVEAYELSDMVLYNLTTTSNGSVLETGGMFYTNATQNSKKLTIDPNKPMLIQIPCIEEKVGMMAFESEIDTAGNINWKNPKPLEQFLTKVDMDLLNYLPEGFEDEVYASVPIMGYKKVDRNMVDSLYYLMALSRSRPIAEFWRKEFKKVREKYSSNEYRIDKESYDDVIVVYKNGIDCGINPLSIKTIRENTNYSNSFLATKEFEERLGELHKLENGQAMLDVYLKNLDKNLWYSDSIVAVSIGEQRDDPAANDKGNVMNLSNRGREKNIFDTFFSQRKTKVKDADLYSEALTKYYNKKKQAYKDEMEKIREKNEIQLAKEIIRINELSQSNNKTNIQNNAITNVNVSRGNNYTVAWASFGWANIDAYLHMVNKSKNPKQVEVTASNGKGKIRMYQWLGAISTLTPIIVNQFKGLVKFPKEGNPGSVKMKNTFTMAISNDGNQWFFGAQRYSPYKTNAVEVQLMETTLTQIKIKLREFNGTTPLIKHLNEDIKRLEQLKKVKQEQLKEDAFINRLKGLCFLCYEGVTVKTEANEIIDIKLKNK